jgi:hypothetical protein
VIFVFSLAVHLLILHGPGGQNIEINPDAVVSLRSPRGNEIEHFQKGIRCLIFTNDGKFTAVIEDCATIHEMLGK